MSKAVEVEVMENVDQALSVQAQPGTEIVVVGLEKMRDRIAAIVADYEGVEIPREYINQAKKERAWLRSLKSSVDQRRKEIKQAYMAPVTAFEATIKDLLGPLDDAAGLLDAQIKAFEEADKTEKKQAIADYWNDFAGDLAGVVDFELVFDSKWLNKSVSLSSAYDAIETAATKIAADVAMLEGLSLAHALEAKAEYFATLDVAKAIARDKDLTAQLERTRELEAAQSNRALEAAKRAQEAFERASAPEVEVPFEQVIAEIVDAPTTETWAVEFTGTREDAIKVAEAVKALGYTGKVRRI